MIKNTPTFKEFLILSFFVLIAVGVNLTKAVHIDDTAYLEMAKAILHDPFHPLSQETNWGNTSEPIFLSVSLITKLFRYSIQQEQRMIGSNLAYAANVK